MPPRIAVGRPLLVVASALMTTRTARTAVTLQYREVFSVSAKRPARLVCVSGSMWLTAHREIDDWLLVDGDIIELDSHRDVVVQALDTSELIIEASATR